MEKIIELEKIKKIYRENGVETPALNGISLPVESGEFLAIMGPSGSGKSTLLHILGLLDEPSQGNYLFLGKKTSLLDEKEKAVIRNKQMGFIFQDFNLLGRISVLENVKLPLLYSGTKEKEQSRTAKEAIEKVGLASRLNYPASKLSGGERQRVAIARAIVQNPAIIFADEPTGNLDSKSGEVIMEILEKLNDNGHTIILITHETYTAQYAQRIIRLKDGLIEKEEKVEKRKTVEKDKFFK